MFAIFVIFFSLSIFQRNIAANLFPAKVYRTRGIEVVALSSNCKSLKINFLFFLITVSSPYVEN